MVEVSVDIDGASLSRMEALLEKVAHDTPQRLGTELRRAALYICQSAKARTKTAPKRIPKWEYALAISPKPPKYIHSNSAGHPLLRRWRLTRLVNTPDSHAFDHYAHTTRHRGPHGKMVGGSPSAEAREILKFHGGIPRAGLAKKSWGWIAKKLYAASSEGDLSWKRTKGERRDPTAAVKGLFRRLGVLAEAIISNNLDYIADALLPGALNEALDAAAKRLEYNIMNHIERAAS